MNVTIKRVYEAPSPSDGMRILVDRLWPRGLTKARAHVDLWLPGVAPSTELRKWFNHDPGLWDEFSRRYRAELKGSSDYGTLEEHVRQTHVTLVYAAKDTAHNNAVVLARLLQSL